MFIDVAKPVFLKINRSSNSVEDYLLSLAFTLPPVLSSSARTGGIMNNK